MKRRRLPQSLVKALLLLLLLGIAAIWVLPLLWTAVVAFRPPNEPLRAGDIWFGSRVTLENFRAALDVVPFGRHFLNSVIFVFGTLAVQLVTITLAGYAFARYTFPLKDTIFLLFLLQLVIPGTTLLVPNSATIRNLGLFDTLLAVMLPYFGSAFGTFLMRQTFLAVPRDLDDASVIDGCRWWQTLWHVYIPNSIPAMVAFGMVSVSYHWSEFLWPLVVTNSAESRPLTVGLSVLTRLGEQGAQWSLVTAGTLLIIGPILLLFLIFQRRFIRSFLYSGLRG